MCRPVVHPPDTSGGQTLRSAPGRTPTEHTKVDLLPIAVGDDAWVRRMPSRIVAPQPPIRHVERLLRRQPKGGLSRHDGLKEGVSAA